MMLTWPGMRRVSLVLLILLLFLPCALHATQESGPRAVGQVSAGAEITFADGTEVALEGIAAPFPGGQWAQKARATLAALIGSRPVTLADASTDRYGRIAAQVYGETKNGKKIWLNGEMLRRGLAFVYPPTGFEPGLAEMLAIEAEARHAKAGIWADPAYQDVPVDQAAKMEGRFAFVSGRIVAAKRTRSKVYLDFGKDWRTDFAVSVAGRDMHNFRKDKIDPLALKGKYVRVRGWVKKDYGPMIEITNPAQMEILSAR
jgi:endonuclease YncB( thermonuclease family)